MKNKNAQEWLDKEYPLDGTCQRDNDSENKDRKREEITKLDISKGKVGWYLNEKNLVGSLSLEGFINLRTLIVSSHQIISLDLSGCSKLEELDCNGNQIDDLNISGCSNLEKINCSNNNIKELDLSNCAELKELRCGSNKNLKEVDINDKYSLCFFGTHGWYLNSIGLRRPELVQYREVVNKQNQQAQILYHPPKNN